MAQSASPGFRLRVTRTRWALNYRGPGPLGTLGHRYLPPGLLGQFIAAPGHGAALSVHQLWLAGTPESLIVRVAPSGNQRPHRGATRNVQHVAHPLGRQAVPKGRRHTEGVVPGNPYGFQMAALQSPLQHLQGQLRRPVPAPVCRHSRRLTPAAVRSPTLRQVQPLVRQGPPQGADIGQKHSGLAVGHLAQSATVLAGHPYGLSPPLGEVAALQHPHRLRCPSLGAKYSCRSSMTASSSQRESVRKRCMARAETPTDSERFSALRRSWDCTCRACR